MLGSRFTTTLFLLAALCSAQAQAPKQKKTPREKLAKLVEPWPAADVLKTRRLDAEKRALFQSEQALVFTLEADFNAVNKDRDPDSKKSYAAVLTIPALDGQTKVVPLSIGVRGHNRLKPGICAFVPLRLDLAKNVALGTALEGPAKTLKLVTHCQNAKDDEQFVLREYLAYKLSNLLTPRSYRARLAQVTYVESKSHKTLTTRYAMLLEDDDDVARRMEGRVVALERALFSDLEPESLAQMMVLQYMLGNTDFSIFGLHNVILVQLPTRALYPVTYDFDLSGIVHAPYAVPAPNLGLKTVLERAYRGPCLTQEQLAPVFSIFQAKKADLLAAASAIPDFSPDVRGEVQRYLGEFFSTIDHPSLVKLDFVDGCKRDTM